MDISRLEAPYEITSIDPWLEPHAGDIELRMNRFKEKRWQIAGPAETLSDFANGFLYYGFHRTENGWVFREWMPGAEEVFLMGDFNNWSRTDHPLEDCACCTVRYAVSGISALGDEQSRNLLG